MGAQKGRRYGPRNWVGPFCLCLILTWNAHGFSLAGDSPIVVATVAPRVEDLSLARVEAIAREAFQKDTGYADEAMADFLFSAELYPEIPDGEEGPVPRHYLATFCYQPGRSRLSYQLWVETPSGKVSPCDNEGFVELLASTKEQDVLDEAVWQHTLEWEVTHGPFPYWPYQVKAAFAAQFGSEPGNCTIQSALALPTAGDLAMEQALLQADAALVREFGLSGPELNELSRDISFYKEWWMEETDDMAPCWVICYRKGVRLEDGLYPLCYQVNVPSRQGATTVWRNMTVPDLMALGLKESTASQMTELNSLLYIPTGGRFFHLRMDCLGVPEKYQPLEEFPLGKLGTAPFDGLLPCPYCVP